MRRAGWLSVLALRRTPAGVSERPTGRADFGQLRRCSSVTMPGIDLSSRLAFGQNRLRRAVQMWSILGLISNHVCSGEGRSGGGLSRVRLPALRSASKMQFILSGCKPAEGPEHTWWNEMGNFNAKLPLSSARPLGARWSVGGYFWLPK